MATIAPVLGSNTNGGKLDKKTALIPITRLKSSRYQTRDTAFENLEELENLANSIKTIGLLELPHVRKDPEDPDYFEIISGHRRIHAVSKFLDWKEVECEILDGVDEFDVFRLNVTENMQRSNLSAYEEGIAFLLCQKLFGLSDEEIATRLHKSRQSVASKRELAVAANHYVKYADSSVANAFLRHFSSSHKESLSRLDDPQKIKQAVTMIARGGTARHLQRFVELFAAQNDNQATTNQQHAIHSHQELKSVEEILSIFEQLKKEMPKKYSGRIDLFEDKFLNADPDGQTVSSSSNFFHDRKFRCPSCKENFEVDRKIVPEQDKVLFIINPRNANLNRPAVFPFPVFYKTKINS